MKRPFTCGAAMLWLLLSAVSIRADLPLPNQPVRPAPTTASGPQANPVVPTDLTIVPQEPNGSHLARLQIPQSMVKQLQAALGSPKPGEATPPGAVTQNITPTLMSGLFLFFAFSFAGVWLARSRSPLGRKAVVSLLLGVTLVGATVAISNANMPPPRFWKRWDALPAALNDGRPTSAGLDIEIVPDGKEMTLIIPLRKSAKPKQ